MVTNQEQKQAWLDGIGEGIVDFTLLGIDNRVAFGVAVSAFCATLLTAAVEHPEWAKTWANVFNVHPENVERLLRTFPITRES